MFSRHPLLGHAQLARGRARKERPMGRKGNVQERILQPVPHRHYTFTIPKALRGLFERERRLLSLLSQTAYESVRKCFQELFPRNDVRPGGVSSIQRLVCCELPPPHS